MPKNYNLSSKSDMRRFGRDLERNLNNQFSKMKVSIPVQTELQHNNSMDFNNLSPYHVPFQMTPEIPVQNINYYNPQFNLFGSIPRRSAANLESRYAFQTF